MKAIKLIGIFIIILCGVLGAFYVFTNKGGGTLPSPPDKTYQTFREQFEKDWEQAGDWDEQLFRSHCDLVLQLSKKYETATLNDLNTKTATEVVYKKIFEEWKSQSCSKAIVEKYNNAIKVIESKDNNAKTDPNVQKIKNVYATYISAYSLAHQGIGLTPHFDGYSWNSYSNYSTSVTNKRNAILGNSYYKEYLSNIADIRNGLNAIPGKLTNGRTRFYNELANRIISYYSKTQSYDRTNSELNRLRNAISQYEEEYSSNSRLSSFAREYAQDVHDNQKSTMGYDR